MRSEGLTGKDFLQMLDLTAGVFMRTLSFLLLAVSFYAGAQSFTSPKGSVSFKSPRDGATVTSPFKVVMDSTVKIRPADQDINDHTTGHHHLLIDTGSIPAGEVIPKDETHLHFGKGQTEADVTLKPGPHTLTLQLADGAHRSYGPALSRTIQIVVK
jgi:Domain of unknown function (DUF4399)